jgi:glycosyltransferase involved in cell wall biosynthesis
MRVAIVSNHGRAPADAEFALTIFIDRLPSDIEPVFFLFEDGEFAAHVRAKYGSATIVESNGNGLFDWLGLTLRLAWALTAGQVDAVLTNSTKSHVAGSIAAKLAGIPCINFVHDLPSGRARFVLREASRIFADERLASAPAVARNLDLPNTTVVYTPLDLERYRKLPPAGSARRRLGIPDDGLPLVGLVGRIARWKGQDRFVRIAAKANRHADARYAIVGSPIFDRDEDYFGEVQALAESLGLEDRFHFIPWQSDASDVYAALDLLCNCSEREPFVRTICESMASGIAVICFNDSGLSDVFGLSDGVTAIPVGDDAAFAEALAAMCADALRTRSLGNAAARAARRLDADALTEAFANVLYRVGGTTSQPAWQATLQPLTPEIRYASYEREPSAV